MTMLKMDDRRANNPLLLFLVAIITSAVMGCSRSVPKTGTDFVNTNNYANQRVEFFYYLPQPILDEKNKPHPLLICVPGLSGRGESFVDDTFKTFAERESFGIIAPSFMFDDQNWVSKTSYQYPSVWSGDALLAMIRKVEEQNGLSFSKYYLFGFSAGAQFVLRFALWKSEICAACAAHGSGGTVVPDRKNEVKFLVGVGKDDTERIRLAETFYSQARAHGIDATYKLYDTGHSLILQQKQDSLEFFKKVKESQNH